MRGLNLSKFKKISSDKDCTVLKSPEGHELRIAHGKVHPNLRKDLESLPIHEANGGKIHHTNPNSVPPSTQSEVIKTNKLNKDSTSAQPQMYAEGTDDIEKVTAGEGDPLPEENSSQEPPGKSPQAPVNININSGPQPMGDSPSAQGNVPTPQPAPAPQDPNAPPEQQDDGGMSKEPPQVATPASQAPIAPPVAAVPPPTPDQQVAQAKQAENVASTPEQYQQAVHQDLDAESLAWQHDLANQHITPKTYESMFGNESTLGKIGMLFGIIVGNGGAVQGKSNAVLDMMTKEINNDLEAQKASKANAQNFIKMNMERQLNDQTIKNMQKSGKLTEAQTSGALLENSIKANALAHNQTNWSALDSLAQKVKLMSDNDPQKPIAQNTLAMMYQRMTLENSSVNAQAAAASALANFGGSNSSGSNEAQFQQNNKMLRMSGNEAQAKDNEAKHFPGIPGKASKDLHPDQEEYLRSGTQFDSQLRDFIKWTKKHSGDINPSDMREGQAMAAELQGAYRQATHGGVFKEGEQNFISKLIDDDPTKFFNKIRVLPSLNALKNTSSAKLNGYAKSLGFDGYVTPGQKEESSSSNQPSTDPKTGRPIQWINGKPFYKKGP